VLKYLFLVVVVVAMLMEPILASADPRGVTQKHPGNHPKCQYIFGQFTQCSPLHVGSC